MRFQREAANALRDYFFKGEVFRTPQTFYEALALAAELEKKREVAEAARLLAEAKIEEDRPKVEFAEDVGMSTKDVSLGDFAKALNNNGLSIGRNRFFEWLRANKYLMPNNRPYQRYVDAGWFVLVEKTREGQFGPVPYFQSRLTGRGQLQLGRKLRESGDFEITNTLSLYVV